MEIKEDFKLVNQPFSLVLASLGLPMDTLAKVRRRLPQPGDTATEAKPLPPATTGLSKKGVLANGSGVGGGAEAGGEEQAGWAGRIAASSSRHAGGGRKPFALRRRATAYQPLENEDGAEQSQGGGSGAPCIEMATLRTAGAAGGGPETPTPQSVGAFAAVAGDTSHDLHDVAPDACVRAGDVLVLSCGRSTMVDAQGSWFSGREAGLGVLGLSTLRLPPRPGSVFFELVLSRTSSFLGRTARRDGGFFSARYGCSVVAFRLKGSTGGGVDLLGRSAAEECDRGGNGASHDAVAAGDSDDSGETTCLGAEQTGRTSGDGLFENSGACRSPQSFAGAAAGAIADDAYDEAFFIEGPGDSPTVRGDRSSPGSTALSPSVGDESPARLSEPEISGPLATSRQQQSTGGAGLDAKSQRRRRRRGEAFDAGDVVIVLASEQFSRRFSSASAAGEFLRNRPVGRVPEPTGWFHYVPLVIFALMLSWVLLGGVDMVSTTIGASWGRVRAF